MNQNDIDDKIIIQYLLGELPEAKQIQLEEQYFPDDELFEQILAVEDELIDDYIQGELSGRQRERFENRFLISPQRRQRVEFGRALMRVVSKEPVTPKRKKPVSWWQSLLTLLHTQNQAVRFVLAAAVLVVVLGGSWLLIETIGLRTHLEQIQTERTALLEREQELWQQVAQQRERSEQLAEQLQSEQNERTRLEQEVENLRSSQPAIVAFALTPGLLRGKISRRLEIPQETRFVQIELDLVTEYEYESYLAVLQTAEWKEIWRPQYKLEAQRTEQGKIVNLMLPASVFTEGVYILTLQGVISSENFEVVGNYFLSLVKK